MSTCLRVFCDKTIAALTPWLKYKNYLIGIFYQTFRNYYAISSNGVISIIRTIHTLSKISGPSGSQESKVCGNPPAICLSFSSRLGSYRRTLEISTLTISDSTVAWTLSTTGETYQTHSYNLKPKKVQSRLKTFEIRTQVSRKRTIRADVSLSSQQLSQANAPLASSHFREWLELLKKENKKKRRCTWCFTFSYNWWGLWGILGCSKNATTTRYCQFCRLYLLW